MTFKAAFKLWIDQQTIDGSGITTNASYLGERTIKDYRACSLALGKFFDDIKLEDVHAGHLMTYQRARALCDQAIGKWARPAGANRIRKEITLLKRILMETGVWGDAHKKHFKPLRPVESDVPRAMTPEEQHRLLHVASSRQDWQLIYCYSILALQTTASPGELSKLRLGDIMLADGVIQIRSKAAKNKYRIRTIPLVTPDVAWALERLMERAKQLGSSKPTHHLFPVKVHRNCYDPSLPMGDSGLKKRWDEVRVAAEMPELRIYDLRHTGITRMAEAGTPIAIIMSFAGHMTLRMQQHYTTVSLSAKRGWAEAIWGLSQSTPQIKRAPENEPGQIPNVLQKPIASVPFDHSAHRSKRHNGKAS